MKEILVIDAPNNCSECPCCHENECGNQYKGYVGDYVGWNSGRPSWCSLKPLPDKKPVSYHDDLYGDVEKNFTNIGWNNCLEEIEKC